MLLSPPIPSLILLKLLNSCCQNLHQLGARPFLITAVSTAWRAWVSEKWYTPSLSWRASAVSPEKSLAWVEGDLAVRPGSAVASCVTLSNPVLWASCDWLSGQSLEDGNRAVFPLQPSTDLRARHTVSSVLKVGLRGRREEGGGRGPMGK